MKVCTGIAWVVTALMATLNAGCGSGESIGSPVPGRWYTNEQVERGRALYQTHCASCHGDSAQGLAADWRKTDASGNYPPPPLNGSAHAWHHPLEMLETTIAEGGEPIGGVMPAFADTLDENGIRATVAYFQSFWPGEIYARWQEINSR